MAKLSYIVNPTPRQVGKMAVDDVVKSYAMYCVVILQSDLPIRPSVNVLLNLPV